MASVKLQEALPEKNPSEESPKVPSDKNSSQIGDYTVNLAGVVGNGAYGIVYTATDAKGNKVAAKRIDGRNKEKMSKITKDLDKLLLLDHPNIVKILDIHQVDTTIWIFMEFCEHGDLDTFYKNNRLSQGSKLELMLQITEGLEYLHNKNIIHRDIKPANILISSDEPIVAKLTDFDFSKFLDPNDDTSRMSTNVGTLVYKAPEFYQRDEDGKIYYHRHVDTFALGLMFLAMDQGNKRLIPQIETPNDPSEKRAAIGQLLAERIKYGKEPLDIVLIDENVLQKLDSVEAHDVLPGASSYDSDRLNKPIELKKLIQKMTCVHPPDRLSATKVVQVLQVLVQSEECPEPDLNHRRIRKFDSTGMERQAKVDACLESSEGMQHHFIVQAAQERKQFSDVNLKKTLGWSIGLHDITVCMNSLGQMVLRGWSLSDDTQYIRVVDKKTGNVLVNMTSQCRHEYCSIISHPVDPDYVLEACYECEAIRRYNIKETERKSVYKDYRSWRLCKGPEGSMFAITCEGELSQQNFREETEEPEMVHKIQTNVKYARGMCYIKQHKILVITSRTGIKAVSAVNGSIVWEFTQDVESEALHAQGLCSDLDGRVYIADGTNKRLLVLDGGTGRLLQVLLEGEIRDWVRDVCYTNDPEKLYIQHGGTFHTGSVNTYDITEL